MIQPLQLRWLLMSVLLRAAAVIWLFKGIQGPTCMCVFDFYNLHS